MPSERTTQLLQAARTALANGDKGTLDKSLYEILKADIQVEEAWQILYAYYGRGKLYPEFKDLYIRKFFPDKAPPPPAEAPSRLSEFLKKPSSVQIPEPIPAPPTLVPAVQKTPTRPRPRMPSPIQIPEPIPAPPTLVPAAQKTPTRPRPQTPSPIQIPEPIPAPPPLVPTEPELQVANQFLCPYCGVPFAAREDVIKHIERWHPTPSKEPEQPERKPPPDTIPSWLNLPKPVSPPEIIEEKKTKKAPWGWIILFICMLAAVVIAAIIFWPYIEQFLLTLVLVFFFPVIFPLALFLAGGLYSIIYGPNWMLRLGMYLVTKWWWWFPVGWIVGSVFFFCRLFSG